MVVVRAVMVCLIAVLAAASPARSDQVFLVNGDRLSGTITRMFQGTLIIETAYAGELRIDWGDVAGLSSDAPIELVLGDDTLVVGRIVKTRDGALQLAPEFSRDLLVFGLDDVKAINPQVVPSLLMAMLFNVGISVEDGNTEAQSYHLDGEFTARTEKNRYRTGGEWNRATSDGVDRIKNWLGYADYRYYLLPKWFLFLNTQLENDPFADLDLRTTLGGGAGHQFLESTAVNLSAETGVTYVHENYNESENSAFAAVQWGVDYNQYFFGDAIQLFHRNSGFVRIDDFENWVIKTRQGIRHPIFQRFKATLQYDYDYNNQPSPDAETAWDWKLMFLLGYQFGN